MPMIVLARLVDERGPQACASATRTRWRKSERQAYAADRAGPLRAATARDVAPDATFTLRLAFGVVKGYEVDGVEAAVTRRRSAAPSQRADKQEHREPFVLPKRWLDGKDKLDLKTPFNFVSTADTIGGNSGSPVLNRAGELVGINFDRNRHGLVRNFVYTDEQARHIAVHSRGVLEALRNSVRREALVEELTKN